MSPHRSSRDEIELLFPGDSEPARLMRNLDWSQTGLDTPAAWPEHWRTAVRLCLTSPMPVVMYCGSTFTALYNDPCIALLGDTQHPRALGRPGREAWAGVWDTIRPMLEGVMATGKATASDDVLTFVARDVPREEVYVRFTFGPLMAADGTVDGIFGPCTETTGRVVSARRLETLRRLRGTPAQARTVAAACRHAAAVLADNPWDIPIAALYVADDTGAQARLIASAGLTDGHPLPAAVSLAGGDPRPWPLASVFASHEAADIADLGLLARRLRGGPWDEPTTRALVVPIPAAGAVAGLLVAGVSARRVLDDAYRTFFDLVAGHIGAAMAEATAYEAGRTPAGPDLSHDDAQAQLQRVRRESQAALRESEAKFSTAFDQSPLVLTITSLDDGRLVEVNEAFVRLSGYTRAEALGRTPDELGLWIEPGLRVERFTRLRAAERVPTVEARFRTKNGDELTGLISSAVVDINARPCVLSSITDITERKRAERALRDRERTQRLLAEIGLFGARTGIAGGMPPDDLMRVICERVAVVLDASRCAFAHVDLDAGQVRVEQDAHGELASLTGTFQLADYSPHFVEDGMAGRTTVMTDVSHDARTAEHYERRYEPLGLRAFVNVPLHRDARWVGNFWVSSHEPRRWTDGDVELVETVAERVWLVVEQARVAAALRESEARLAEQKAALELAVNGAAIDEVLTVLVRAGQRQFGEDARTAVFIVGRDGAELRVSAAAGLPEGDTRAVDGLAIGPHSPSCGTVAYTGQAVIVGDVATDPLWAPHLHLAHEHGIAACWSFPIRAPGGRVLGTYAIYHRTPREADERDLERGGLLARTAAIIIERHQETEVRKETEEALRVQQERLMLELTATRRLQEISTQLIQEDRVELLYEQILDAAALIMGAEYASIQTLYPDRGPGGELRLISYRGFDAHAAKFWEWVRPASHSTCGVVLRTGQRCIVPDVRACDFMAGSNEQDVYLEAGIHAVQTTPLVSRSGRLLGMISTHWRQPHQPSERDLRLLDVLARQAADLIERKQADDALRDQSETLETLNAIGKTIGAELDIQSLVQAVTDVATKLTGATSGAFMYNTVDDRGESSTLSTLSGAARDAFANVMLLRATALFRRTFRGDGVVRIADLARDPRDGHVPVTSYLAVPVVSRSGEVIGGLFFGHPRADVFTERHERIVAGIAAQAAIAIDNARLYEAERAARAHAETANRMKDEFLATLSHELRTPLTAILGWARMLRTAGTITDQGRALATIERNADLQRQLIEDLLDVSKIITGKLVIDTRLTDVTTVIDAAIDVVRPAVDAKRIRLGINLDPDARMIVADPNRLQQIIWNLLSNAVKFTDAGGRIAVRTARTDQSIEIEVRDTGRGIGAAFMPFVFERFRQADSSTTRAHGGLGLGLAIVRHVAELHGGTVRVTSAGEGKGATFTVTLPATLTYETVAEGGRRPAVVPGAASPRPEVKGVKVLVVEDEADARDLFTSLLEQAGAVVRAVSTAREALAAWRESVPDVLLCDIGLPGEDGFSLIQTIRCFDRERGGGVPAAALTAYARPEDRVRTAAAGFQAHVAKPVDPDELLRVVATLARRSHEGG